MTVPLALAFVLMILMHWTEQSVRIAGEALQICGLLGVAKGVADTRAQFGHRSLYKRFGKAVRDAMSAATKRFQEFFGTAPVPPAVFVALTGQAANVSAGSVTVGVAPPRDVNSRLDALELFVEQLNAKVVKQRGEIDEQLRNHAQALSAEQDARAADDREILRKLEATATGGLDMSICGVVWLAVASIYCTFPQGVADRAADMARIWSGATQTASLPAGAPESRLTAPSAVCRLINPRAPVLDLHRAC
jgi:hypothetical protein